MIVVTAVVYPELEYPHGVIVMKTAVFGHDETCDDTALSLNSGAILPLTFAPPASRSVSSTLQIRGGVSNVLNTYRSHQPRRTSRMQNVSNACSLISDRFTSIICFYLFIF